MLSEPKTKTKQKTIVLWLFLDRLLAWLGSRTSGLAFLPQLLSTHFRINQTEIFVSQ